MSGSIIYLSHGGGPLPLLGDESHRELVDVLQQAAKHLAPPSAIVVISAHWEESKPTITSGEKPSLIYDYYGFPEASYHIKYPAPGEPQLAKRIADLLQDQGIEAILDDQRGYDHGLFVPLKIMYPDAAIPCVQLSLLKNLNPEKHIQMGRALSGLLHDNLLIVGSGFSFHNISAFFLPLTEETRKMNEAFEQWLYDTCANHRLTEAEKEQRLIHWKNAPYAGFCHPREEHLLPLHVCCGAAQAPAKKVFTFKVLGIQASAYLW
jgi:4,5-DOPA dioxygenase extradiol